MSLTDEERLALSDKYDLVLDIDKSPEFQALLADDEFCVELWTAFANRDWYRDVIRDQDDETQIVEALTLTQEERSWGASFRGMGGVIADLRNRYHAKSEDYMDWYCCNQQPYGYVSDRVEDALGKMGWHPLDM